MKQKKAKNKIGILLLNCFFAVMTIYAYVYTRREAHIASIQKPIVCQVLEASSGGGRIRPTALVHYKGKKYHSGIRSSDRLKIGYNDTTFHYDE